MLRQARGEPLGIAVSASWPDAAAAFQQSVITAEYRTLAGNRELITRECRRANSAFWTMMSDYLLTVSIQKQFSISLPTRNGIISEHSLRRLHRLGAGDC